jgi:two-component system, OmpR family, sensor kinase
MDAGMKTLLAKTRTRFATCMAVVFLLTTPLFYLITRHFYAEDMMDIIESVERGEGIPALDLEQDIMIGVMLQFLLVFLAVGLSYYLAARFAMHSLWHPFDDTLRKTEQFNLAQGDIPQFMETDVCEFDRLNHSLMRLMEKDRETFRIQKEFSENASHEQQTPLAVMRSKLDLLMQENLTERQMHIVADLYQMTTRLSRLNRNLLLLAKIDNAQYATQDEVDIVFLLSGMLDMYDSLRQGVSVKVDDRRAKPESTVRANYFLLESLLKNLIVNAIRHTASGREVVILVETNGLTVSNPSADNTPLDASTLFHRFANSDKPRTGNGLGLAIVKAVCDFHGWTVHYEFFACEHRFIVRFNNVQP